MKITFHASTISIEMTGNKSDSYGNSKLMSFGLENQVLTVTKIKKIIKLNAFGLTLGTYNSSEELYKFLMRSKNTMSSIFENLQSIKRERYNLQELIEKAKEVKNIPNGPSAVKLPRVEKQQRLISPIKPLGRPTGHFGTS